MSKSKAIMKGMQKINMTNSLLPVGDYPYNKDEYSFDERRVFF